MGKRLTHVTVPRRPAWRVASELPDEPTPAAADPCGNRAQRREATRVGLKPPAGCGCRLHTREDR